MPSRRVDLLSPSSPPRPVEEATLDSAVVWLCGREPALATLAARNGSPPLWYRPPGFASIVTLILEQQVSLASARAAVKRLEATIGRVEPTSFLTLDEAALRTIGFSRQKAEYCRDLAAAIRDGSVDLEHIDGLGAADAGRLLTAIRGVGPWTAECYLLFCLRMPDAWPSGDRALQVSIAEVFSLETVPDAASVDAMAEAWRPWRSVAARMLWHEYLSSRDAAPVALGTTEQRG